LTVPTTSAAGTCTVSATEFQIANGGTTTTAIPVGTTTVEAIATAAGYNNSPLASATYTIKNPTAATPTFSEAAGIYYTPQTVTVADATNPTASIYYTTNGTTPTTSLAPCSNPCTITSGPVTGEVSVPTTIKAIAGGTGFTSSGVATHVFTIKALAPTFSPEGGTYLTAQTVTITNNTNSSGASIYYTLTASGTTPTSSNSTLYTGPVPVSSTEVLEAVAAYDAPLLSESSVHKATYTIKAPAPTFSPGGGVYTAAQSVTLADTLSGATICWTTDGTTPALGATSGTCASDITTGYVVGSGTFTPIVISAGTPSSPNKVTIKAIVGLLDGFAASNVTSATYTIP